MDQLYSAIDTVKGRHITPTTPTCVKELTGSCVDYIIVCKNLLTKTHAHLDVDLDFYRWGSAIAEEAPAEEAPAEEAAAETPETPETPENTEEA